MTVAPRPVRVSRIAPSLRALPARAQPVRRLVCFPHSGSGAAFYRPLGQAMPPDWEVLIVQYPGREDRSREVLKPDPSLLSAAIAEDLLAQPALDTVLFGHSLGAALSFEAVRRTEACRPVSLLVVSGREQLRSKSSLVAGRTDEDIWEEIRAFGGTSPVALADEDIRQIALSVLRTDYALNDAYWPPADRRVGCPLVAVAGTQDPLVRVDELRSAWADRTTGSFSQWVHPGGHFGVFEHLDRLVRLLTSGTVGAPPR